MVSLTADVVIIGGGILGAATVFELSQRGVTAVLLERGLPGRQGSGTTAGNLHIQAIHSKRPGQGVPVDNTRLVPLQLATSQLWERVTERLGTDVQLVRSGGFTVAETAEEVAELHAKAEWERAAGLPTEVLDGAAARAAMPHLGGSVLAATWCALDGHASSLLATPAYLVGARKAGARVYTNAPVSAIDRTGGTWTVTSPIGTVSAPIVINAAGPWIQQVSALAGFDIAMSPLAIQMHETVRTPRFLEHLVQHVGRGLSVKQVPSGSVVIGGGWPAASLQLGGYSPTSVWAGPLAATPDEMPVIGEITGSEGFYVQGGTYAFTFSPLWAATTADLIAGSVPAHDVTDLGPDRLLSIETIGAH
jgi:sarcosine oxidase subunit beta